MKWIGQHIFDLKSKFRNDVIIDGDLTVGDVTIDGDLTVSGTYTQIDTDVTTTEQWLVTNDGTGPAAIINQKGSQDIFDVQDDGTSVFYIEDGGKVGIGTTSPSFELDVVGNIGMDNKLYHNGDHNTYIGFESDDIKLRTGGVDVITVNSSQNVGIGTTSPSQKLDVNGNIKAYTYYVGNTSNYIDVATGLRFRSNSDGIRFMPNGADAVKFLANGNVGIGDTSPSYKLVVKDSNNSWSQVITSGTDKNTGNIYTNDAGSWTVGIRGADSDKFYIGNQIGLSAGKFVIDTSGNVGIGTTSPSNKLDVVGDVKIHNTGSGNNATLFIDTVSGGNADSILNFREATVDRASLYWDGGDNDLYLTTTTGDFLINPSGNVGIGTTSPEEKLSVSGSVQLTNQQELTWADIGDGNTGRVSIRGNEDDDWIMFKTDNSERMRLTNTGLGIGTTSPGQKLEVDEGYINVTGAGTSHGYELERDGLDTYRIRHLDGGLTIYNSTDTRKEMTFRGDGNVGIGTASPSNKLSIKASSATEAVFGIQYSSTTTNFLEVGVAAHDSYLTLKNSGTTEVIKLNSDGDSYLNGGNVGIGTTSPNALLDVDNRIYLQDDGTVKWGASANAGHLTWDTNQAIVKGLSGQALLLGSNNTSARMTIDTSGNVGIGTTSPDDVLHVLKDQGGVASALKLENKAGANNTGFDIDFQLASSGLSAKIGAIRTNNPGAGDTDMFFSTSTNGSTATEAMRITHGGNVGIGTTSPGQKLEVNSGTTNVVSVFKSTDNQAWVSVQDDDSGTYGALFGTDTDAGHDIVLADKSANKRLVIDGSGNVGIGTTSPASLLHVAGTVQVGVDDTGHDVKFFGATSGASFLYDESEDGVVITHPTDDAGLEVYTISSGTPLGPQLKVGRDYTQYWGVYTVDRTAHLVHRQDETDSGAMNTSFELWGNGSGNDNWVWRHGTRSGGSLATVMTLDKAGQLTVTGEIEGGSLDINGNADISGNTQLGGTLTVGVDDTGHDVVFYGATSGKKLTWDESADSLYFADDTYLRLGDGGDVKMWHNGDDSYIMNLVGDLNILNSANDKDIILSSDDGSGGHTAYLTLDGSGSQIHIAKPMRFPDSVGATFGTGDDLEIYHEGTYSNINNKLGHLYISNTADDSDVIFRSDNGSGGLVTYFFLDGSLANGTYTYTRWADNDVVAFGDSQDFLIYHNSWNTLLYNSVGDIQITNAADDKDISFRCDDGSGGTTAYLTLDGSVTRTIFNENAQLVDAKYLYFGTGSDAHIRHDGSNFSLTNTAGNITILNATDDGDIIFQADDGSGGNATYLTLDGSASRTTVQKQMRFEDGVHLTIGNGGDLELSHDGSISSINNYVGNFYIRQQADDGDIIFQSDDGSGGVETYFFLDGSLSGGTPYTKFPDRSTLSFGDGNDLQIIHSYGNSLVRNFVGDLYITQYTNDGDIILSSDDGSGGITAYLTLDGGLGHITVQKLMKFEDSVHARFGNGSDLRIFHDGSNSEMNNHTGHLSFINYADDKDIIFKSDNGSGGTETYFYLDGSNNIMRSEKEIRFVDSAKASFGNAADLKMYHNATNSYVENETGNLYILNKADDADIVFQSDDGSGGVATYFSLDGSAATHDGSATTSLQTLWPDNSRIVMGTGADFYMHHSGSEFLMSNATGTMAFYQQATDGDMKFYCDNGSGGNAVYLTLDGGISSILAYRDILMANDGANGNIKLGASQDLVLNHDGTNSIIQNATGDLKIINYADDKDIRFFSDDGSGGVTQYLALDGSLGWTVASKNIQFSDSIKASFGSSVDMIIQHNGTNSYVENATGNLEIINGQDDGDIIFKSDDGSGGLATYLMLDGSIGATIVPDSKSLGFGTGGDMYISHDTTNTHITNFTGDLYITNRADDKDVILRSDDGSGGHTAYLTLDGGLGYTTVQKEMRFDDSTAATFGASGDLQISHNGSSSSLANYTGNFFIQNQADDADIIFQSDDGSGGVETYFSLDGSVGMTVFPDAKKLAFGSSFDLKIEHDGSNSYLSHEGTGNLIIRNTTDDADIVFQSDDGSGGVAEYLTLDGSANTVKLFSTLTVGTGSATMSGILDITNTTDSSDATGDTGALRLEGGASIAKKLYVGTDLDVGGTLTVDTPLATDQQKHLAWFEIAGFGTGDGTNYEISVNLDNDTAPFSHNVSTGSAGTTAITVQNIMRSGGTVMTRAGTIKRWTGWATTAGSSTANVALFKITPARNDNSDVAPVLIDNVSYTAVGNTKMLDFNETEFADASVAAGDIVVTGIKCENTKTTYFSSTLEIEF